ncbi:isoprenyl transferase [Alphaproteobacteria bacterium]|nr:isoprenyl transferase [Alphaproteobacteria bacterium]
MNTPSPSLDAQLTARLKGLKIPRHLAIIMDGNGRWALARGRPRMEGHIEGARAVERLFDAAYAVGVRYLSVFAFSTENWERPAAEVNGLMRLLTDYLGRAGERRPGVRFVWAGEDDGALPHPIVAKLKKLAADTAGEDRMTIAIAINYGGRQEIVAAVKRAHEAGKIAGLTVENFREHLVGGDRPDIDFVIRTSGERRISNFMLWQLAYAEMFFPDYHWPDFDATRLVEAVEEFNRRDRRFGAIKEGDANVSA